jgi:2-polyprenyl-6-hydroxyphenyl methylase/3-demethylubiquinone-9 3-methyltransferase
MAQHTLEVQSGERFEFGKNWTRFLGSLNEERTVLAQKSLSERLELETLQGKTFVDIGSGSGLFSLAARKLGARVHSFDYDPHSVKCTRELKRRYFPDDPQWTIDEGSALDNDYLRSLGTFDVVYSWGVLQHHTGDMWTALDNVAPLVREGGILFISLYNDQGTASRRWKKTKKLYNYLPHGLRFLVVAPCFVVLWWRRLLKDALRASPSAAYGNAGRAAA